METMLKLLQIQSRLVSVNSATLTLLLPTLEDSLKSLQVIMMNSNQIEPEG